MPVLSGPRQMGYENLKIEKAVNDVRNSATPVSIWQDADVEEPPAPYPDLAHVQDLLTWWRMFPNMLNIFREIGFCIYLHQKMKNWFLCTYI